jgi:hypothetical protein
MRVTCTAKPSQGCICAGATAVLLLLSRETTGSTNARQVSEALAVFNVTFLVTISYFVRFVWMVMLNLSSSCAEAASI